MDYPLLKLAAIDIGSNAVRCQISAVLHYGDRYRLKRVEYVRYPLRLGEDVFATGTISEKKQEKFIKFLHALRLLMEVHDVAPNHYLICATSAMRTAANGTEVANRIQRELGMTVNVIDGQAEAAYINRVIEHLLEDNKHYLHIDVGGGSTEFNIYHDRRKVASQSFEVGSIRRMQQEEAGLNPDHTNGIWQRMEAWVKENGRKYHVTRAIGTGGNINKLYSLAQSQATLDKPVTRRRMATVLENLTRMTMDERVNVAMLNPDRADVIIPAGHIYLSAMEWANISQMIVPDIGLKDGMLQTLFETHFDEIRPSTDHSSVTPVASVSIRSGEME
ncbi:exopolyphosphatase / guanosine-5'-triphosphate,3'-diphosphate pyrophosphatase [Hymenobacter daecheongensis DSM 21074]|uniref:Exopolyphosphatase / guanosine-5'-triphosphate,3'-diphosphate pyrophosphatase n=1 Tax=Hymenobacter daecheongensis DSM 21074 TaxID=1121955 RepID=A0A1M6EDB0_9BACT|nr:phosphatase [Hymenobacter daecheongensis]SHI83466.1 exopolyphosphatase / guanosine-5'-triphosphate,3'-diphosphate pyrophosphatase [Hymenobacter daecheongensis DSM 21074]